MAPLTAKVYRLGALNRKFASKAPRRRHHVSRYQIVWPKLSSYILFPLLDDCACRNYALGLLFLFSLFFFVGSLNPICVLERSRVRRLRDDRYYGIRILLRVSVIGVLKESEAAGSWFFPLQQRLCEKCKGILKHPFSHRFHNLSK